MKQRRLWRLIAVTGGGVGLLSGLTACGPGTGGVAAVACVSWIDVSDPQVAYDEADAVVLATADSTSETKRMFGVDASVHRLPVAEVLKGDIDDESLKVASTPATCMGDAIYPDGDPLDVDGSVIVFLRETQSGGDPWSLITPFDTVLPATSTDDLPFDDVTPADD